MEFTSAGDDVLTGLGDPGLDTWVRFSETLETFDEFGEISGVLDLNSDLDDGRDGELHDLHVVCRLGSGEGTTLEQELIDTDETNDVTGGAVFKSLDSATHHENGTLDGLDKQVILLSRDIIGALDTDFGASTNGTGEDTSEGVETTLIGGGHHLGDVQDQRSLRVAVTDADGGFIVHGTLVEGLNTIALSGSGRGKVDNDHLQEGVAGRQELPHDDLQEGLTLELPLIGEKLDIELLEHASNLVFLEVHDGIEDLEDGVQDEAVECTVESLAVNGPPVGGLTVDDLAFDGLPIDSIPVGYVLRGPFLCEGVEIVVAPKLGHHFLLVNTELLGETASKLAESEGPSMETGAEGDGTLFGVNLDIAESFVVVRGNDDVDTFDGT